MIESIAETAEEQHEDLGCGDPDNRSGMNHPTDDRIAFDQPKPKTSHRGNKVQDLKIHEQLHAEHKVPDVARFLPPAADS